MRVELNDIYIGNRVRKDYGKKEMEELVESMRENGQITAITVRPPSIDEEHADDFETQSWVLVAGGRRLLAAATLGWETIEAYALEEMEPLTHRVLELEENLKRKAMSWQEEVDAKAEIVRLRKIENPDITEREIAKEIGESPANLSKDLKTARLLEANPQLRRSTSKNQALNTGTILEHQRKQVARMQSEGSMAFTTISDAIHTQKAEDFLPNMPDNSVDLMLLDGPYGIDYWSMAKVSGVQEGGEHHMAAYDDNPTRVFAMYEEIFPELVRATRETGWIVFFCSTQLERHLRVLAQRLCRVHAEYFVEDTRRCSHYTGSEGEEKCEALAPEEIPWIWYKPNASSSSRFAHLHASNRYELILPINMGKGRLMSTVGNVLPYEVNYGKDDRIHGVQRPIELLQELVKRFTYAGDKVVDVFMGSGSALAAAASLGRRFEGCDQNPALREFAIGLVTKHYKPVAPSEIKASEDRYERAISGEPGEPSRPIPNRPAGMSFDYETMKVGGRGWMGYIKYDGHNMGQKWADTEDELIGKLMDACEALNNLSTLGIIDPCCCSPDDAMEALWNYEAAQAEDAAIELGG